MILATTVVRGAEKDTSHGGLYLIDPSSGSSTQIIDWADKDFDFKGRGGDRGLRGVVHHDGAIYAAAADRILKIVDGSIIETITHPLMGLLHDMTITSTGLAVVSTRVDCILHYDWNDGFNAVLYLNPDGKVENVDPSATLPEDNVWHLNSVGFHGGIYFSGLRTTRIYCSRENGFGFISPLPRGTHNTRLTRHGLVYCDTNNETLFVFGKSYSLPRSILPYSSSIAKSRFIRGIVIDDDIIYVGSSPSQIIPFYANKGRWGTPIVLSDDFHNSIQSLFQA